MKVPLIDALKPGPLRSPAMAQTFLLILGVCLVAWGGPLMLYPGLLWIVPIIIAIDLGFRRGRKGWMWGLFLGWVGVLILACMRSLPAVDESRESDSQRELADARRRLTELETQRELADLQRRIAELEHRN